MKIFVILLITLLIISTVSAWTGTTPLNINCTDQRPCGLSAKCIQGRCFPLPGPLTGLDEPYVNGCYVECEEPYECVDRRCVSRKI